MTGNKNSKQCDLVAEYGFFETQEDRTRFLEKRDSREIKTLFNIWAFLFGPLAYIFSGMFLKGAMWILIILSLLSFEYTLDVYVIKSSILENLTLLSPTLIAAFCIFLFLTHDYFSKHKLIAIASFVLFSVVTFFSYLIFDLTISNFFQYLTNMRLGNIGSAFLTFEFNILIAFLYTIDRCKQIYSNKEDKQ